MMKIGKNKYEKWYDQLVKNARLKHGPVNWKYRKGFAKHHILPKSLGGSDNIDNLVWLTHREHLIAHMLLPKFIDKCEMWYALWCMCNMGNVKINSKTYEKIRIEVMENRKKDITWIRNLKIAAQKRAQDPKWISNNKTGTKAGALKRARDPMWLRQRKITAQKTNKKLAQDPNWIKNHTDALKIAAQKPLIRANRALGRILSGNAVRYPNKIVERSGLFEILKNDKLDTKANLALALLSY